MGESILVVERATRTARVQGTRDTFVQTGFLTVRRGAEVSDYAEDEFQRIENFAIPTVRELGNGAPLADHHQMSVVALAALLFSRSFATELVRGRAAQTVLDQAVGGLNADPRALRVVQSGGGTVESISNLLVASWTEEWETRGLQVKSIIEYYNRALDYLKKRELHLFRALPGVEFITSDNPLVLSGDDRLMRLGVHNGVGLHSAAKIVLPLSRTTCVVFGVAGEGYHVHQATRAWARTVNNASWRNSVRYVACHPDLDWSAAAGLG